MVGGEEKLSSGRDRNGRGGRGGETEGTEWKRGRKESWLRWGPYSPYEHATNDHRTPLLTKRPYCIQHGSYSAACLTLHPPL